MTVAVIVSLKSSILAAIQHPAGELSVKVWLCVCMSLFVLRRKNTESLVLTYSFYHKPDKADFDLQPQPQTHTSMYLHTQGQAKSRTECLEKCDWNTRVSHFPTCTRLVMLCMADLSQAHTIHRRWFTLIKHTDTYQRLRSCCELVRNLKNKDEGRVM